MAKSNETSSSSSSSSSSHQMLSAADYLETGDTPFETQQQKPTVASHQSTNTLAHTSLLLKSPRHSLPVEHLTPDSRTASLHTPTTSPHTCTTAFDPDTSSADSTSNPLPDADLINSLTAILSATCQENSSSQQVGETAATTGYRSHRYPDGSSSLFFSLHRPTIPLRDYVERLVHYLRVSRSVFVVALIYLDRICREDVLLALNDLNVHRLLTTALGLAAKYLEDESFSNCTVCRIGGVPSVKEMNMLEFQFLRRLRWCCSVSSQLYCVYAQSVLTRHAYSPQAVHFDHPM